jgi:hypothetical protein
MNLAIPTNIAKNYCHILMRNTKRPISPPNLLRPGAPTWTMKAYKSSKTLKLIDPLAPTISSEFKSFNFPGINAQPKLRCSNITPQAIHKSPNIPGDRAIKPGDRAIKVTQNIFVSPK